MKSVKLETAQFDFLESNILRVCVFAGVDIDEAIAKQYCDTLAQITNGPTGLIVDKKNEYSLTFSAQSRFFNNPPNIVATAILIHRATTEIAARTQLPILRTDKHPVEIFHSEDNAIRWLKKLLAGT